jgi:Skp family chaperone for outer membrane proteins
MTKSKDPLSSAVDIAFGLASSAMSIAAAQVRNVSTSKKSDGPDNFDSRDSTSSVAPSDVDLSRQIEIVLEREGVARQDELAALRRSIAAIQAELGSTQEEIAKLRRKIKKLKEESAHES